MRNVGNIIVRLWLAFALWAAVAFGGPQPLPPPDCLDIFAFVQPVVVRPTQDTSIELELATSKRLIQIMTTENGKLSGLLGDVRPPSWLIDELAPKIGSRDRDAITSASWDLLTVDQKLRLMQHVAYKQGARSRFFDDRTFHGLKIRDRVIIEFTEPTTILGKTYPPGKHNLAIGQFFKTKVEHGSPDGANEAKTFELHFRLGGSHGDIAVPIPAGSVSKGASELLEALGIRPPHQHAHIVASLPRERLMKEGDMQVLRMGEFYRRANLALEMISLMEYKSTIRPKTKGWFSVVEYWNNMSSENLEGVFDYFRRVANGGNPKIGDDYKMAYVGMRGSDKYDGPEPLWGIEVRYIPKNANRDGHKRVLDALQWSMQNDSYGIPDAQLQRWKEKFVRPGNVAQAVPKLWYNRGTLPLIFSSNTETRQALGGLLGGLKQSWWISGIAKEHREVKMLLHDWSQDPLVFENPALAAKIRATQAEALKQLRDGENPTKAVRYFLKESGLYESVLGSLAAPQPGN